MTSDPYVCHLKAEVLIRHGYEVNAAEDGAAAWEELHVHNYNLLIADQKVPKVSVVELLKKLHAARMALPVILATNALPTRKFTLLPWLQPATMLRKPYTFQNLLGMVNNVLYATAIAPWTDCAAFNLARPIGRNWFATMMLPRRDGYPVEGDKSILRTFKLRDL